MRRSARHHRSLITLCVAAIMFVLVPAAHAAPTQTAYVRINQLGYLSGSPKEAFLMSTIDGAGGTFSVVNVATNTPAFTATVPASAGGWSAAFGFVHPLDFSALTTAGRYKIVVTGAAAATSPRFRIGTDAALYHQPLANALFFYQTERDGPNFMPLGAARGARAPQRPERDDVPDAEGELRRRLQGRPRRRSACGSMRRGDGGTRATTRSSSRRRATRSTCCSAGVRDFPQQMGGDSSGSSNFTTRRGSG